MELGLGFEFRFEVGFELVLVLLVGFGETLVVSIAGIDTLLLLPLLALLQAVIPIAIANGNNIDTLIGNF
ncbi:hypothetical protein ABRG53_2203 [Pseudanabaena sp. ABRG5-3]|nr:hypothetical protein ABRG53_2203 [Pseudanabaena sp. ABRG5-3]